MKIKVIRFQAEQIVAAWKKDALVGSIGHMFSDIRLPWYIRVRVFLADHNKLASNELWENHPNRATSHLVSDGLRKINEKDLHVVMNTLWHAGEVGMKQFRQQKPPSP